MKAGLLKLALLIIGCGACFSESKPTPVASVKLNSIVSDQAIRLLHGITIVFLSDSQLAVAFQNLPVANQDQQHVIAILSLKPGSMGVFARRDGMPVDADFAGLRRTSDGQLVVSFDGDVRIYDANLNEAHRFHARPSFLISPTGRTVVVSPDLPTSREVTISRDVAWNVFRTDPVSLLTNIATLPLAISDDAFAVQDRNSILVKGFDGTRKGSVATSKKCENQLDFLGGDKLYLEACRHGWTQEIVDFAGRTLVSLKLPKGWGHNQVDNGGDRMVFDIFTESKWASIKGFKNFEDTPDGEAIRVIDTKTGNTCFSLNLPMDKAHEGPMHASISPSGKSVVVVNDDAISVFELPSGSCVRP